MLQSMQVVALQLRYGRNFLDYDYGRAVLITGRVSINGRPWKRGTFCDYAVPAAAADGRHERLQVGQILDFVNISYKHKQHAELGARYRTSTREGNLLFARIRQYYPRPDRYQNMWVLPRKPRYQNEVKAIPVGDLCMYLHRAPEHTGRVGLMNLVPVAKSFV
tara:strand:- start:57 stop:545 length:489 start_codon:yes stop_codon:yes gene_type:complete